MSKKIIEKAKEKFEAILTEQLGRVEALKKSCEKTDFTLLDQIKIGVCWGDGIGKIISKHAQSVLEYVLKDEVASGKIKFKDIAGLTIENRAKQKKAIPDDVLEEIKSCHVILKGPTTTPQTGDEWPNIESANVAMRRSLDLYANVRPVKIPQEGIDWCFFRENTEGEYVLGSKGFDVSDDLSIDFKVITEQGSERIIRMALEYAKNNDILSKSNDVLSESIYVLTIYSYYLPIRFVVLSKSNYVLPIYFDVLTISNDNLTISFDVLSINFFRKKQFPVIFGIRLFNFQICIAF